MSSSISQEVTPDTSRDPIYKPEKPLWLSMPQEGTYISICVDPVGTLEAIGDAEIKAAAAKMKTQTYIGYVEEILNEEDEEFPFRGVSVRLLHRGMPALSESEGIEPSMCIPVRPTAFHPHSVRPLVPSKPLPWSDCYHHTLLPKAVFRVRHRKAYDNDSWWLKAGEMRRVRQASRDDAEKCDTLLRAYRRAHGETLSHDSHSQDNLASDDEEDHRQGDPPTGNPDEESDEEAEHEQPDDKLEDLVAMVAMMNATAKEGRPHDTMTLATASYEIDAVSSWAQPEDFFKEQSRLLELETQFRERAVAKAKQSDEAAYGTSAQQTKESYGRKMKSKTVLYPLKLVSAAHKKAMRLLTTLRGFVKLRLRKSNV